MIAKFETALVAKKIGETSKWWGLSTRSIWQLTEDLVYKSNIVGLVYVPAGFITDYASVPRVPIVWEIAGDTAHEAATAHDWLYQTHPCTKLRADRVFREAMAATGIDAWRKDIMFAAVVAAGWNSWRTGPKRFKKLGN